MCIALFGALVVSLLCVCVCDTRACCGPSGGEALVSCSMMESLLKVINWFGDGQDHITVRAPCLDVSHSPLNTTTLTHHPLTDTLLKRAVTRGRPH